jgi:hypothetical protein
MTDQEQRLTPRIKTKRKFKQIDQSDDDPLPQNYRHIRNSERILKDQFYNTVANLSGARAYGKGLPKVLLRPAMPYPSTPC